MRAAAIDAFGGVDVIKLRSLPVPDVGPDEVLVRVECAGVAVWDPFEREGGFASHVPGGPKFPYIMGTDGAGTVAAVGGKVSRFKVGDRVYAVALANPKGGFYAEYAAVTQDLVSHIPGKLTVEQAGVMPSDALTGLHGLDEVLGLKSGETVMVFGAGGGIGHMAVQLARRMGARVFAVASGDDGVALVKRLGIEAVVNGRRDDVASAARAFAPHGLDAALMTAGGEVADAALRSLRSGGRAAYPDGVEPAPKAPANVSLKNFSVDPKRQEIEKLNRLIDLSATPPFTVHVARSFTLEQAPTAHRALDEHFLGKLALRLT
jgi:NADPH:quinone reductase-like Zn-dependent oxidoreductase